MAGLLMTVIPLITAVMGPISGTMSDHIGSELPTMIGLIFTTIGLALMTMLGIDTTIAVIILFLAVIAVGSALFQSPNNSLVMGSVSRDELGLVGSLAGLVRNMGMSVGITAAGAVVAEISHLTLTVQGVDSNDVGIAFEPPDGGAVFVAVGELVA